MRVSDSDVRQGELVCAQSPVPSLQQEESKGLCVEIRTELLPRTTGDGTARAATETEMTCQRFHTVSRMRENCTYGSMRGIRRKTAKHVLRVAEGRAEVPCGGVSPYSTPFSVLLGHYNNGDFSFYETNNVTRRNVVDDYSHICCAC